MQLGAVGGAVVAHHAFGADAVAAEEGQRAAQEADRGRRLLVGQHLGVGQTSRVVDRDVDELPADLASAQPGTVGLGRIPAPLAGHAVTGAALEPAELLDVNMISSPGRPRS